MKKLNESSELQDSSAVQDSYKPKSKAIIVDFIADPNNEPLLQKLRSLIISMGCDTNRLIQHYRDKSQIKQLKFQMRKIDAHVLSKEAFVLVTEAIVTEALVNGQSADVETLSLEDISQIEPLV